MTALPPYPEYKDSGVPWLGEVPAYWQQVALWKLSRPRAERNPGNLMLLSVFLDRGVIPYAQGGGQVHAPSLDLSNYQVVHPGDFVLNNQQAWRGSVGVSAHNGIISPAYIVLELSNVLNPTYANYLFRSPAMVAQYVTASKGVGDIQRQIYWPYLRLVQVPLPPPDEQAAIVRYLDHMDRRIRRYIRARRRLIALLGEQKQAIIHQAVTRGLDPSVPLKPSGVEWLGDVPAHWEVVRSKRLFSPRKELARDEDIQLSATQAYGVIPQAEFEEKVGRRVVQVFLHLDKRRHVEKDDFVISMRSFQGGLERAWASGCIRSSYVVLQPSPGIHVDFFAYLFKSYGYIQALQTTANFIRDGQDLNFGNFSQVDLPLVPYDEQRAIAEYLDRATSGIAYGIVRAQREIDLIREYRTRLIADVVTGKVDVRAAAAALPAEFDEPVDALYEGEDDDADAGDEDEGEGEEE